MRINPSLRNNNNNKKRRWMVNTLSEAERAFYLDVCYVIYLSIFAPAIKIRFCNKGNHVSLCGFLCSATLHLKCTCSLNADKIFYDVRAFGWMFSILFFIFCHPFQFASSENDADTQDEPLFARAFKHTLLYSKTVKGFEVWHNSRSLHHDIRFNWFLHRN